MAAAPPEQPDTQSWDDFWAEINAHSRVETVRGVQVPIPVDLPMQMMVRVEQLSDSESIDDVRSLVAEVFGSDLFDQLVDAGVGSIEFRTLLGWAVAQGSGRNISFREAYDLVRQVESDGQGKAPAGNRAARRARLTSGTGGRSKRTSPVSTGSRRRASGR